MIALKQYQRFTLPYQVTTGYQNDARGNKVPVTAQRTLKVVLQAKDASKSAYGVGADETQLFVEGACAEPKLLPKEIVPGQTFEFDYSGRRAKLTIYPLPRRPIAKLDLKFGQGFEGQVTL